MFIKSDVIFKEITENEDIGDNEELQAIEVNGMIIVNLYNKPNNDLPINYLNYFTKYFKLLILGDFNAHQRIWGSTNCNRCGAALADWVTSNDYILLNTTQPTHYSDAYLNIWSLLDLSIASPGLAHKCTTIITSDFLGSDHSILFVNINKNVRCNSMHIPRWSFPRANWPAFSAQCELQLGSSLVNDIDKSADNITETLILAATNTIPKTKPFNKPFAPWWNKQCSAAVKARKHVFKCMQLCTTPENVITFKRTRYNFKRTIFEAKTNYWQSYCSSLDCNSKLGQVWKPIKSFTGQAKTYRIGTLQDISETVTTSHEKANMLAKYFHSAKSTNNLSCVFLSERNLISRSVEQLITQCECKDNRLNLPLTANEFKACVSRTKNTSPGGDQICYEMLKHLSDYSINVIIQFFNKIWFTGKIPKNWLHSIVIAIYKPNRPIRSPTSYRPISLISNLSKIMEKIITRQLIWYLETNNLLSPYQSGFRSCR